MLKHIERVIERLLGWHRLSLLRGEQHRKRHTQLCAPLPIILFTIGRAAALRPPALISGGQVVEGYCEVGMIGTKRLLADRRRALVERLGLGSRPWSP